MTATATAARPAFDHISKIPARMPLADARAFIASADSRETSGSVMRAIVHFSASLEEAERIWDEGIGDWTPDYAQTFLEIATASTPFEDLVWGGLPLMVTRRP